MWLQKKLFSCVHCFSSHWPNCYVPVTSICSPADIYSPERVLLWSAESLLCLIPVTVIPLTLSISFYRPDLAEPANTINYRTRQRNALFDLQPRLNQLKSPSPLGRKECSPAQMLVIACLH